MSPFFIFATEMFKDEVDAYFVALCICFRRWVVVKSVSSVHIDTMGIYPVARAIEDIVAPVDGGWIISSFHSHVGLGRIRDVYVSAGLVLVSASTSGSMVNRLVQDGVSSALIVTIFDVAKRDPHFVLHSFDVDSLTLCGGGGEGVIDIAGEYFVATGKKPRAVVIGVRHKPAALSSVIDSLVPKNGIRLNSPRPGNVQCTDAAHIDESLLCKADGVRDWIKKEVQWRVPSGVSHVVYGGDGARGMAEEALKAIQADGYDGAALVSSNEVVDLNSSDVRGVLVCCGVVGNGHLIRSISRDLRHAVGDVPRHFMVGIAVPDSQSSWKRLVQFLVQSGSRDYPYGISCWKVLPIGSDARQAWQSSLQLSSELDHIEVNPAWGMGKEVAEASIDDARSALSKCAGGFLESPLGKKQRLTNGFVYWVPPKKARIEDYDSEVVAFLSISSALQAAREADDQSIRLASTLHEVVVLDPEIFSRFNDGVLQSAILRAAKIGELNYTASPNHSELMREILEKVIANRALAAGEACLEFALALATGRLVLTPADSKLLRDYVIAEVQEQSPLLGLLCAYFKRI
ncbi:hypothetical protein [Stenotrophomonas maltophilia]|uniref:hypothetical protein n=1 Tax=Stenotrophomonas maltophilia TaxID=40324 RepID=UPI0011B22789|nr:hypothetical protein [Stenotrophomonas maltophilia]